MCWRTRAKRRVNMSLLVEATSSSRLSSSITQIDLRLNDIRERLQCVHRLSNIVQPNQRILVRTSRLERIRPVRQVLKLLVVHRAERRAIERGRGGGRRWRWSRGRGGSGSGFRGEAGDRISAVRVVDELRSSSCADAVTECSRLAGLCERRGCSSQGRLQHFFEERMQNAESDGIMVRR